MSLILSVMAIHLLIQCCLTSPGETGCSTWIPNGEGDVCCKSCHPGNRLVKRCGQNPKTLCTMCEASTFTKGPAQPSCTACTQCVGAQVLVKECTSTTDTVCGCRKGLRCGNNRCSFCVDECVKGQEPTEKRSCRECPDGMFNDQIHQKCKPWRTVCTHPGEYIVEKGDAFTDSKCSGNGSVSVMETVKKQRNPDVDYTMLACWVFLALFSMFMIIIIVQITRKTKEAKKKEEKTKAKKTPIITTPTDDPRTLVAVECSFHEAYTEQGSSSESLPTEDSESSKQQLIV